MEVPEPADSIKKRHVLETVDFSAQHSSSGDETLEDDFDDDDDISCFNVLPETPDSDFFLRFHQQRMSRRIGYYSIDRPYSFPLSVKPKQRQSKPYLVGAGLFNLGNTCFLNSVLQCLTHTFPMVSGLRSCAESHKLHCDRITVDFCVLCTLFEHIECSLESLGGIVSPLRLVENLKYISSFFERHQQEDAHEFLQCLLDKLDNCFLDSNTSQDDNLVKKIFGGRLVSKLKCCNCNRCSYSFESIIDLSLEIKDVDSLPKALESFTSVEKIGDLDTKYTCENCKQEVSAEKQFMFEQAPSVATFHLKRFMNDGVCVEKIDKDVAYPLALDLQAFISDIDNATVDLKYELYAIIVHIGSSSDSGHYFSFVRTNPETWYKLDDSKVTRVREGYVLSQKAYVLFYARQGTPWFSSLFGTKDLCVEFDRNTSPTSVLDLGGNSTSCSNADKNRSPFDEVEDTEVPHNKLPRSPRLHLYGKEPMGDSSINIPNHLDEQKNRKRGASNRALGDSRRMKRNKHVLRHKMSKSRMLCSQGVDSRTNGTKRRLALSSDREDTCRKSYPKSIRHPVMIFR